MPARDVRKKFAARKAFHGSQLIFGERQHLREVLRSVSSGRLPAARKKGELRMLRALIEARTEELNGISPGWDRKYRKALDPKTPPGVLARLGAALVDADFLLARALSAHPNASGEMLDALAHHPYAAVRENVARHPHTPPDVLRRLAADSREPLWFLVACNPSTPQDLLGQLRARMRAGAEIP